MSRMASRVAITGFGVITASGAGKGALERAIAGGVSPVRPMELFDVRTCRSRTAAQVGNLDAEDLNMLVDEAGAIVLR